MSSYTRKLGVARCYSLGGATIANNRVTPLTALFPITSVSACETPRVAPCIARVDALTRGDALRGDIDDVERDGRRAPRHESRSGLLN